MENTVETVDKLVEKSVESVKKWEQEPLKKVFDRFHRGNVENFWETVQRKNRHNNGYKNGD